MSKEMEIHEFCEIFPQGDEQTISDLADSIALHGLQEKIITYKGKILDGRNRYIACKQAGVEPVFEEYDGDKALQFVISKNLHRRHLNVSQRAMIANEVWEKMKEGKVPGATLERIAKQFRVCERTIRDAGIVKRSSSESVQRAVFEGTVKVNQAINALQQAAEEIGVHVTKDSKPEEKKKAHEAQERIIRGESSRPPDKPAKTPRQVLSGKSSEKRWQKNILEMQASLAPIERLPSLYHYCFEGLKEVSNEALLNTMCGVYIEAVKKLKDRLQRNDKPDYRKIQKFFDDLRTKYFSDLEHELGSEEKELSEELKQKLISNCDKYVKEVENVRRKLGVVINNPKQNESEPVDSSGIDPTSEISDTV